MRHNKFLAPSSQNPDMSEWWTQTDLQRILLTHWRHDYPAITWPDLTNESQLNKIKEIFCFQERVALNCPTTCWVVTSSQHLRLYVPVNCSSKPLCLLLLHTGAHSSWSQTTASTEPGGNNRLLEAGDFGVRTSPLTSCSPADFPLCLHWNLIICR